MTSHVRYNPNSFPEVRNQKTPSAERPAGPTAEPRGRAGREGNFAPSSEARSSSVAEGRGQAPASTCAAPGTEFPTLCRNAMTSHVTDEETAQRGEATGPKAHSWEEESRDCRRGSPWRPGAGEKGRVGQRQGN